MKVFISTCRETCENCLPQCLWRCASMLCVHTLVPTRHTGTTNSINLLLKTIDFNCKIIIHGWHDTLNKFQKNNNVPQLHHQTRNHHSTPPLTTFFNPANPPLASSWTPMIPSPHPPNLYRTVHPPQQHQVTT